MRACKILFFVFINIVIIPFISESFHINAIVIGPLSGTYTINAGGPGDFTSLKEAADVYNRDGLSGNATFQILSDLVETATAEFKGTAPNSGTYSLTITTDNTVTRKVSGSINGSLIKMTGANNITIDGIVSATEANPTAPLLAFSNTFATAGTAIRTLSVEKDGASNGANIRVKNVEFSLATAQRASGGGTIVDYSIDSIWISNSYIHNGYTGINGSTTRYGNIQNNIISDNHARGIYLTFSLNTGPSSLAINGNVIKDLLPISGAKQVLYGIYANHFAGGGNWDISNNKVDNLNNQSGVECSTYGVYIYTAAITKFNNNKINNLYNISTSVGFSLVGVYIYTTFSNYIECSNDTISNLNSESFSIGVNIYSSVSSSTPMLMKNCQINNITGKGVRASDLLNSMGIYAFGAVNLDANVISNIKNTANNATASSVGIYAARINATNGFISNNMVTDIAGRIGIGIAVTGTVNLYHNSVRLINKFNDTDEATLIDLGDRSNSNAPSNIRLKNNLLSNEVATGASQNFVIKKQVGGVSTIFTDPVNSNNRYYALNGNIGMNVTDRTLQTGTVYATLADWRTFSSDNSLKVAQPAFAGINDLHLTAFPYALQVPVLTAVPAIPVDLDGDSRMSCGNSAGADISPLGQGPLHGVYRIGDAATDDFSSLKQAADVYNSCGLSANTTFMIVSDLVEIATTEFKGSAPNSTLYTLTITSDNTVQRKVTASISGILVKLAGANNVIFDGIVPATELTPDVSKLAFINTYPNASGTVRTLEVTTEGTSQGVGVRILNTNFGLMEKTASGGAVIYYAINNLDVEGCYIHDGNAGIINASGTNVQILNNIISGCYLYGINIVPLSTSTNITITGNVVRDMTASGSIVRMVGIRVINTGGTGTWNISNNKVMNLSNQYTSSTTTEGINIDGGAVIKVNNNIVTNLFNGATAAPFDVYGIYITSRNAGSAEILNDSVTLLRSPVVAVGILASQTNTSIPGIIKNCYVSSISTTGSRIDGLNSAGIYLNGAINADANTVTNIKNTGGSAIGLYSEAKTLGYISNCMISDVAGAMGIGIQFVGATQIGIYHNTVRLTSKQNDNHESVAINIGSLSFTSGSLNFVILKNNLFSNEVTTGPDKNFIIKLQPLGAITGQTTSYNRYNLLAGNIGMKVDNITTQTGTTYTTLADWRTYLSDNSLMVAQPAFVAMDNLHLTNSPYSLDVPLISTVPADLDGEIRSACGNTAGADFFPVIHPPLSGTYTIGNSTSNDFTSLAQAADVYNNCGLAGNTTFMIVGDITEINTVEFKGSAPNSTLYTLTITSDNTVPRKINGSIIGPLVKLTGANNITIDGINPATESVPDASTLVFKNTYSFQASVRALETTVEGTSHGTGVHILNTNFGTLQSSYSGAAVINNFNNNLHIEGCYIHNSYVGINSNAAGNNFKILNNIVSESYSYGMNIVPLSVADITITGNVVKDMTATTASIKMAGIRINNSAGTGSWNVSNNKINNLNNQHTSATTTDGIAVDGSASIKVNNNKITNLINGANTSPNALQGLYIVARNTTGKAEILNDSISSLSSLTQAIGINTSQTNTLSPAIIKNCYISTISGTGTQSNGINAVGFYLAGAVNADANTVTNVKNTAGSAIGIYSDTKTVGNISNNMVSDVAGTMGIGIHVLGTTPIGLYQNTVRLISKQNDNHEAIAVNIGSLTAATGSSLAVMLRNNLLSNEVTSGSSKNFIVKLQPLGAISNPGLSNNRYNIVSGNIGMKVTNITTQTGNVYSTLANWVSYSGDNSVLNLPSFKSNNDLHLTNFPYSLIVPPVSDVTTDFDGEMRSNCNNAAGADTDPSIETTLNGTYTVGPLATDDFNSLQQAAYFYNNCGLTGNTILKITSDLLETAMVEFKGSAPGSTLYTLTITSDNTVQRKVSGSINGVLIKLTGANNIIFDGIEPATELTPNVSKLAFINTYPTASGGVRALEVMLDGTSQGGGVRVLNTNFGLMEKTAVGSAVIYYGTHNLDIEGCYIHDGNAGIISAAGNNIQILNNVISGNYLLGINVIPLNPANITITGNIVNEMNATTANVKMAGIRVVNSGSAGTWNISDNKIANLNNQHVTTTTTDGIAVDGSANIKLNNNKITNLTNGASASPNGLSGLNILSRNAGSLEILNDSISSLSSATHAVGINVSHSNTAIPGIIRNSSVSGINATGNQSNGFNAVGIYLTGAVNADANTIINVKNTVGTAIGIMSESKTVGSISNCMVSDIAGTMGIGIHFVGTTPIGLYHNTVRLTSKLDDNHEAIAVNVGSLVTATGSVQSVILRNNLLSNEVPNGSNKNFIMKLQPLGSLSNPDLSNNRYNIVSGNIGMKVANIATQTGTVYTPLLDWMAFSGDNSALNVPSFRGANDLHLTTFPYSLIVPLISDVTVDFDNELRSTCTNAAGADTDPSIITTLNGTYTIGTQATADFNSLQQAAYFYNNCGLVGNTIFKISSDLQETATSEFKGSASGSDTFTLTITSDGSQRKVSGNINGSLVQFTGANNIIIDGGIAADSVQIDQSINNTLLVFENTNAINATSLKIQPVSPTNQGVNIAVKNATFQSNLTTNNSKGIDVSTTSSVTDVSGNYFTNSIFGINMVDVLSGKYESNVFRNLGKYGLVDLVNATTSGLNLSITKNNIKGINFTGTEAHLAGIAVLATNASGILSVESNKIANISNTQPSGDAENITARGIRINFAGTLSCKEDSVSTIYNAYGSYSQGILVNVYGTGVANIDSCVIDGIEGSKQVIGIFANARDNGAVYNVNSSRIDNIKSSGSAANYYSIGICADGFGTVMNNKISNIMSPDYYGFGIQTQWTTGNNSESLLLANNMIHDIKAKFGYGIYADETLLKQQIFHNTIVLSATGLSGSTTSNIGYTLSSSNDIQIKNNILVNKDLTGTTRLFEGSELSLGKPVLSGNKYTIASGNIGVLGSTTYNDLTSWNTAINDNSILSDPVFVSPTDLHLNAPSTTDETLFSSLLSKVTTDIDGDSRSSCNNMAGADNTSLVKVPKVTLTTAPLATICQGETANIGFSFTGSAPWTLTYNNGSSDQTVSGITGNPYFLAVSPTATATYTVVNLVDGDGCPGSGTPTATIVVETLTADFEFSTINDDSHHYQFTDKSIVNGGNITSWSWDFGDGNTDSGQNPEHTYAAVGIYNVVLQVTGDAGCISSVSKTIEIVNDNYVAIADFTVNDSIQCFSGNTFRFTNKSVVVPPNELTAYIWTFGDGETSNEVNPVHQYAEQGTYNVELIVVGTYANDTIVKTVKVYNASMVKPNDQILCEGELSKEIVFEGNANTYSWTGGASIGLNDGADAKHIPPFTAKNGTPNTIKDTIYVIPSIRTNNLVCYGDSTAFTITVNPHPVAAITGDSLICSGTTVTYTTQAGMNNYLWTVTGGTITSGGSTSDHTVTVLWTSTAGIGNVSVRYANSSGCTSAVATVNVNMRNGVIITSQPIASSTICSGGSFQLRVEASGSNLKYQWYHNNQIIQNANGAVYFVNQGKPEDTGEYYVIVSNACNSVNSNTVRVDVGIPNILIQKWDNVLAVNCLPEENGGYLFKSFKWYKNGVLLQGEIKSYYRVLPDNIDRTAVYMAEVTTESGEVYRSCGQSFVAKNSISIVAYPNPVQTGQRVSIVTENDEKSHIEYILSNSMGQVISRKPIVNKLTEVVMPNAKGIYMIRVTTDAGYQKEFKIIVN